MKLRLVVLVMLSLWLVCCGVGAALARPGEPLPSTAWPTRGAGASASPAPAPPGPLEILTEPGELPYLELATSDPAHRQRLPLKRTDVRATLTGYVADVEVRQTYKNDHATPIEAVYVFPLPENSAVFDLRIVVGARVIEADVQERRQARRTYEQAKAAGHTAALLEQERPNVFTQSVANIEPGSTIEVVIRYVQDLTYDAGRYEFVFPMVVGPRFMPGAPLPGPNSGTGAAPDTDRVPDASRISPPYVGRGQRSGHDISIEVTAAPGTPISGVQVPTHRVDTKPLPGGAVQLRLAQEREIPNRDFVLRYGVAAPQPSGSLHLTDSGYFTLVVHPPALDIDKLVGQREIIFVVDVSGSMEGTPLAMCRRAMHEAIRRLRPVDTFNVLTFSGDTRAAFEAPRPANTANIREALSLIDGLQAGGGTHMADAVAAALSPTIQTERHRYVFFLTDGYVGNEDEIIAASARFVRRHEARGRRARVFGYGVGSSVNRHLLDGLSKSGRGLAVYATPRENPLDAVDRFYGYIDQPVLTDLRFDWGGLQPTELFPSASPELFASHALVLHGRYQGKTRGVTLHGRAADRTVSVPIRVSNLTGASARVHGTLWARSKVSELEQQLWDGAGASAVRAITDLGIEHHLVTRFTSFVAVDRSRRVATAAPTTIVQPLDAPEGVNLESAGGTAAPSGEGYGYSFNDDPLNTGGFTRASVPTPAAPAAAAPATGDDADDICRIDPAACPTLDLQPEALRAPPSEVHLTATKSSPRRGCGCRTAGAPSDSRVPLLLGAVAVVVAVSRRRRACCGVAR